MSEPIVIILQTFKRTDVALRTIAAARANLRYDGSLWWYVADDGSPIEHFEAVWQALDGADRIGGHTQRRGYGGNANAAWEHADRIGPLTLWLEDDWELREPLDLWPYAALLMEREDVGMVRLGYINEARCGEWWTHAGLGYHDMERMPPDTSFYAFTGHPSLRHRRYREAYGDYPEGLKPGETELQYAYQYRVGPSDGPAIVWPVAYPYGGLFAHIGTVKTETLL